MKKERNSNIELLRIICMLFIVAGHFIGQTGFLDNSLTLNNILLAIFGSGARIATNIFLLIAVWFLVDKEYNPKRVLMMYLQLLFYTAIFTIVALLLKANPSIKDTLRGFLPFFGRALWFVSAYITLSLLTPILKRFFDLPIKQQITFDIISFVLVSGVSTLPDAQTFYLVDSLWFIFVYLWIGTYKRLYIKDQLKFKPSPTYIFVGGALRSA